MKLQVSLDGGKTYVEATEGVMVIVSELTAELTVEGKTPNPETTELHVNFTDEGIIHDVWVPYDLDERWQMGEAEERNVGTRSQMYDELLLSLTQAYEDYDRYSTDTGE